MKTLTTTHSSPLIHIYNLFTPINFKDHQLIMMMATTTISPPPPPPPPTTTTTKPFTTIFLILFSIFLLFLLLIIASFIQQQGFSSHELVTLPPHQRVLSTGSSPSLKELHFQGVPKGWKSRNSRRLMIGSTAPICTYNECRGCKFRCRAEQIPVDANDPINSAYHYRCICHR